MAAAEAHWADRRGVLTDKGIRLRRRVQRFYGTVAKTLLWALAPLPATLSTARALQVWEHRTWRS
eukprot:13203059-Alexandrium_andersonii.AAC.1